MKTFLQSLSIMFFMYAVMISYYATWTCTVENFDRWLITVFITAGVGFTFLEISKKYK